MLEPKPIVPPAPSGAEPAGVLPVEIAAVDFSEIQTIQWLNKTIFKEDRVINSFDREDLLMLLARHEGEAVGFKIGYRESRHTFYSAKGGVLPDYRRQGIAYALLKTMVERARTQGYRRLAYDTFPNMHAGMTILGLTYGFRVTKADYNSVYKDYRLRLEKNIAEDA